MSNEEYLIIMDAIKNCPMTIKENIAIANFIAGLVEE
jgi:hypothetical protein|tara:strand:- start:583 stop:693 length:111 start_codon:yes stop_codon:yes gene_type:complete